MTVINGGGLEKVQEVANKYFPDRDKGRYVLYIVNPLIK